MSFVKRPVNRDWHNGMPRHRWLSFLRGTASTGVLAGVTASACAALPYTGIVVDPRIPVVTGSGAPVVFGAGLAMVVASIASLWWANARIRKPLDRMHLAVGRAVSDGFRSKLDLPTNGIGPILINTTDRLHDITVSVTDADLHDGERHLRMVFRNDAASRFQGILSSLNTVHDGIIAREAERDQQQRAILERAARAALTLEEATLRHDTERLRLAAAVQDSKETLAAIHAHFTRLQQIDPSAVDAIITRLGDQTQSIIAIVDANRAAHGQLGNASDSLRHSSDDLRNSFQQIKREFEDAAVDVRTVTRKQEAALTEAVSTMESRLREIEANLARTSENVSLTGHQLRATSDALQNDQARNQAAFAQALDAFSANCNRLLGSVHAGLNSSMTTTHAAIRKSIESSNATMNETLANLDRAVTRRLREVEAATGQFESAITAALRGNQAAIEASVSWLDASIAGAIERNQNAIEQSTSEIGDSVSKALALQSAAIAGSVTALTTEIGKDLAANQERLAASAQRFETELVSRMTDGRDVLNDAIDKVDRLLDAAEAAEARLGHAVETASQAIEQTAQATGEDLAALTRKTAAAIETMVHEVDAKLDVATQGVGQAAVDAMNSRMGAVHQAAELHAGFLKAATAQMRKEAERLGEAQYASDIVRSMAQLAEEQLRGVSKAFEDKSEAAIQAFQRAAHEIEHRSKGTAERIEKVHAQAEKSNALLSSSIEPLVGLLGRTRTVLDNISEIEADQLGPALRRIQSSLHGITSYIETSGDEQVSRVTAAVREEMRRTAADITGPIDQILPAVSEQNQKLVQLESALQQLGKMGANASSDLIREITEFCADQIAAAIARLNKVENGIEDRLNHIGNAIEQVRVQTPQQIEQAVDTLRARFDERAGARQAGMETAFEMLQASIEKQLSALSATMNRIATAQTETTHNSVESAAAKVVENGISKLADELKARLDTMSAHIADRNAQIGSADGARNGSFGLGAAEATLAKGATNPPLNQQISAIQGLIEAVERQAIELAHVATEHPELLSEMPEAGEVLASAEDALAAWTRQLDNVSTAVAIVRDAAHMDKRAA
jgi:hypothetical protein